MGVWRQTSAYRILQSRIPCSMPYKKHTTLFTSCPHFTWPHYVLGKALTIAASKWMCSEAKAPMSSASLHHRFHPLYLLKIGQGNPSRAYLRGNKKLAEKTVLLPLLLEHGERCGCCYLGHWGMCGLCHENICQANRSFRLEWRQVWIHKKPHFFYPIIAKSSLLLLPLLLLPWLLVNGGGAWWWYWLDGSISLLWYRTTY